jgi:hypothetical protein
MRTEPKGPDYRLCDSVGTGTIVEIAEQVREIAHATISGYTIEEAVAYTRHAAVIADDRERAITKLQGYEGKNVRAWKKSRKWKANSDRILASIEKWKRAADRYSFLKPAGKNYAGEKVYTGTTRKAKQFLCDRSDCKPGSRQEMFWGLCDDCGLAYFFQPTLIQLIEIALENNGEFIHEDGTELSAEERSAIVAKVWDVGRRGKDRRGFFDKKQFDQFGDMPVWYAIGTKEQTWDDVKNLPIPEPEPTELQAKLKAMFKGLLGFVRRLDNGLSWKNGDYDPDKDPLVQHLIDSGFVHDGEDSKGEFKTAEEWAQLMIHLAQDIDDHRKKPLYADRDPQSPNYGAMCYAGHIPEADYDKWRSLPLCVLGSYAFHKAAQAIGPYSEVGKVRKRAVKTRPMFGCNPMWQAETAIEIGLCKLDNFGQIAGTNSLANIEAGRKADQDRKVAESRAIEEHRKSEAERRAVELLKDHNQRKNVVLSEANDRDYKSLLFTYKKNGWTDEELRFDVKNAAAAGEIVISEDRSRVTAARFIPAA